MWIENIFVDHLYACRLMMSTGCQMNHCEQQADDTEVYRLITKESLQTAYL
jgi:hypothetical protein